MTPLLTAIWISCLVAGAHMAVERYARRRGWSADAELAIMGALWLLCGGVALFFLGGGR